MEQRIGFEGAANPTGDQIPGHVPFGEEPSSEALNPFVISAIQQLKTQESVLVHLLGCLQSEIEAKLEKMKIKSLSLIEKVKVDIGEACADKVDQWRTTSADLTKVQQQIQVFERMVGALASFHTRVCES